MVTIGILAMIALIVGGYFIIKMTSVAPSDKAKNYQHNRNSVLKSRIIRLDKNSKNGDLVNAYPVPNSEKVNFYHKNSSGGEGLAGFVIDKRCWEMTNKNVFEKASIKKVSENSGYIIFELKK